MSRRNRSSRKPDRDPETKCRKVAESRAAAHPVWEWHWEAGALAAEHGGTIADWLRLMFGYRPWRDFPDGRRERWSVIDELPFMGEKLDEIVAVYRGRHWAGFVFWDPRGRRHVMVPDGQSVFDPQRGLMNSPPRLNEAEVVAAARNLGESLNELSEAIDFCDVAGSAVVRVPPVLRRLASFAGQVEAAADQLLTDCERVIDAVRAMESVYR